MNTQQVNWLIVGDSWGEPPWRNPSPGRTYEGHITALLRSQGHIVANFSHSGAGNTAGIEHALSVFAPNTLHGFAPGASVLWFHTEQLRDCDLTGRETPRDLQRMIACQAQQDYDRMRLLCEQFTLKLVVVEAEAPIVESEAHRLPDRTRRLENFRGWCLNTRDNLATQWGLVLHLLRDGVLQDSPRFYSEIGDELEHALHIDSVVRQNPQVFPDGAHAGDSAHKKLLTYLGEHND